MDIRATVVGPFQSNAWLVRDRRGTAVLVDPGDEAGRLLGLLERGNLNLAAILLTHGHIDHVGAAADLASGTGTRVFIHPLDRPVLDMIPSQCRLFGLPAVAPPAAAGDLADEAELVFGDLRFRCLHTPGHSPGHTCLRVSCDGEEALMAGDLLFAGSIGRTDLWGGDGRAMQASLERVAKLPPELAVHPGHGPSTTIGRELRSNPFLNGTYEL